MCGERTRSMRRGSATIRRAPCAQAPLHLRGEHRMAVGRVRADHEDHVGLHHRVEILRAGRLAQRVLESVAGRRMAHARAGVDVVVAEAGAHQLLHEVGLLVGAARGGDAADGVAAVLRLDALELRRRVARSPPPRRPRARDRVIFSRIMRLQDAVRMRRVADGETALDAGVPVIGVPVLVRAPCAPVPRPSSRRGTSSRRRSRRRW